MTEPIRIGLVDDQDMVRAGFGMILGLEDDFEIVGEAATGKDAIALAKTPNIDVLLMDVQMPEMDGLEATREIHDQLADPPFVIILTTFERDEYIFEALRVGASGFLLKNAPPEDLIDAIRVVASGEALLSPSVTRRVIETFAGGVEPTARPDEVDQLTEREFEVLGQVAKGLSNAEIAEVLFVGEATVKTHVSNVLSKLHLRDRVQAVVFAYRHGLVD